MGSIAHEVDTIFDGNLDRGFQLGAVGAVRPTAGSGWDIVPLDADGNIDGAPIAWFEQVSEALRYLKARNDAYRTATASCEMLRWGLAENDQSSMLCEVEGCDEPADPCGCGNAHCKNHPHEPKEQ